MKCVASLSIAIAILFAVQVLGDDNPLEGAMTGLVDKYHKAFDDLKKSVQDMGESAKAGFKSGTEKLEKKIADGIDSIRHRRSAESHESEEAQTPTHLDDIKRRAEGALDAIGRAYEKLKDRVNSTIHNVQAKNWDEVQGSIANQYDKFKDSISAAKDNLKSSIHNLTAPEDHQPEAPPVHY